MSVTEYLNEIVTRSAPRWAWLNMDELINLVIEEMEIDEQQANYLRKAVEAMRDTTEHE